MSTPIKYFHPSGCENFAEHQTTCPQDKINDLCGTNATDSIELETIRPPFFKGLYDDEIVDTREQDGKLLYPGHTRHRAKQNRDRTSYVPGRGKCYNDYWKKWKNTNDPDLAADDDDNDVEIDVPDTDKGLRKWLKNNITDPEHRARVLKSNDLPGLKQTMRNAVIKGNSATVRSIIKYFHMYDANDEDLADFYHDMTLIAIRSHKSDIVEMFLNWWVYPGVEVKDSSTDFDENFLWHAFVYAKPEKEIDVQKNTKIKNMLLAWKLPSPPVLYHLLGQSKDVVAFILNWHGDSEWQWINPNDAIEKGAPPLIDDLMEDVYDREDKIDIISLLLKWKGPNGERYRPPKWLSKFLKQKEFFEKLLQRLNK